MYKLPDVNITLKTFEGEAIKEMDGKELILKDVLTNQLGSYQGKGVSGDMLIKAYDLGLKVYGATKEVELDDEQVKFVKTVLESNPMYTSIVMGQVLRIIENSKVEQEKLDEKSVPREK